MLDSADIMHREQSGVNTALRSYTKLALSNRLTWRIITFVVMIVVNAVCSGYSGGETLNDLKGLSIQSVWYLQVDVKNTNTGKNSRSIFHVDRNIYISSKGNIFEYQLQSTSPSQKPIMNIAELNKAYNRGGVYSNQLYTWTFLNEHLTLINQFARGHRVFSYVISPSTLTCALQARDEPDTATNSMADYGVRNGVLYEILGMTFAGSMCTVLRGNIFAADQ